MKIFSEATLSILMLLALIAIVVSTIMARESVGISKLAKPGENRGVLNKKSGCFLGYVGDEILPSYVGIGIINHYFLNVSK